MKLDGKVAVVVGGGRNVGEGISHLFTKEGAKISIFDADEGRASSVTNALKKEGGQAMYTIGDVTKPADVSAMIDATVKAFGHVDILCNCAAISDRQNLFDLADEEWEKVLSVTLSGSYYCLRYAAIQMRKQGTGGAIVNFSSGSAFRGSALRISYDAAKGGIVAMTRSAAVQLTPYNIRVNAIAPGMVGSQVGGMIPPNERQFHNLLGKMTMPSDMAKVVLFLVSDDSGHIIGQTINVDAGGSA
ncbi:MAG: SDR family oxidoreductase [Dehalococcoidia bacterium]|nr:SDR family oxidoreductase [Dehalococcoidia bacterium]